MRHHVDTQQSLSYDVETNNRAIAEANAFAARYAAQFTPAGGAAGSSGSSGSSGGLGGSSSGLGGSGGAMDEDNDDDGQNSQFLNFEFWAQKGHVQGTGRAEGARA